MTLSKLRGRAGQAIGHVLIVVSSRAKAFFESFHRRGQDQKDHRVGVTRTYLLGALNFNFQQDVRAGGRFWQGRTVEVSLELGPLEKLSFVNRLFERRPVHEVILATFFAAAPFASRPTTTQPEAIVGVDETSGQGSLAHPTGTNQNDRQWISGQELETVQRAA